jgi:hypothetical protein
MQQALKHLLVIINLTTELVLRIILGLKALNKPWKDKP